MSKLKNEPEPCSYGHATEQMLLVIDLIVGLNISQQQISRDILGKRNRL